MGSPEGVSFLWPAHVALGPPDLKPRLTVEQATDLELTTLVEALCYDPSDARGVTEILSGLCQDPAVIAYRQGVLDCILGSPALAAALEALLPKIDLLRRHHAPREKGELLHQVVWRLGELEIFLDCVRELAGALGALPGDGLAEGLRRARDPIIGLIRSEPVDQLAKELPRLLSEVRGTRSLTVGINVDQDFQPSSATLLSINARSFGDRSPSLLGRLFGGGRFGDRQEPQGGIAPLRRVPSGSANPMLQPLFRDLSELLTRTLRPVAAELQRFVGVNGSFLDRWGRELAFYLGAVRLIRRVRGAGLPLCWPQVSTAGADGYRAEGCYNLVLALKLAAQGHEAELSRLVVANDLSLGPREIAVLTGPNQGGKTTLMRSVGLARVMGQAGLPVPGTRAAMSVVDAIHTHFPHGERGDLDSGRFAEEMRRLRDIFAQATPASLVLLNESLATTSPRESLELAREVVSALQVLGAPAIYTTHLYELASEAEAFNTGTAGPGRVASLVARPDRSYRIEAGPPAWSSQAREVAVRCGISYDQLIELLRSRGIAPRAAPADE